MKPGKRGEAAACRGTMKFSTPYHEKQQTAIRMQRALNRRLRGAAASWFAKRYRDPPNKLQAQIFAWRSFCAALSRSGRSRGCAIGQRERCGATSTTWSQVPVLLTATRRRGSADDGRDGTRLRRMGSIPGCAHTSGAHPERMHGVSPWCYDGSTIAYADRAPGPGPFHFIPDDRPDARSFRSTTTATDPIIEFNNVWWRASTAVGGNAERVPGRFASVRQGRSVTPYNDGRLMHAVARAIR